MGVLGSPVLCLRFCIDWKVFRLPGQRGSVKKTPFQPLAFPDPGQHLLWRQGKRGFGSPDVWAWKGQGGGDPWSSARKCLHAPLTWCRPEGQMGQADRERGACGFPRLARLQGRWGTGTRRAAARPPGSRSSPGPQNTPAQSPLLRSSEGTDEVPGPPWTLRDQPRAWRTLRPEIKTAWVKVRAVTEPFLPPVPSTGRDTEEERV